MNKILKMTELFSAVVAREMDKLTKDGLISIHGDYTGKINIHVTAAYFEENFSNYETKSVDSPEYSNVRLSFETTSGNEIFCLKKATFERVA